MTYELNQTRLRGGERLPHAAIRRAFSVSQRIARLNDRAHISIAFVSEREMKTLNKTWRGKDRVTDVLSFGDVRRDAYGELILSYEQAARQARQLHHSTRDELIFLMVHGLLHLHGHDHMKPAEAKKMFGLQTKILTVLGIDPRL